MNKIILLAAFGVAGLVNAKSFNMEIKKDLKIYYHPIALTSSCGYTQVVEVGPYDQPDCYLVDLQQMEDECAAPFSNPMMGMW